MRTNQHRLWRLAEPLLKKYYEVEFSWTEEDEKNYQAWLVALAEAGIEVKGPDHE